MCDDLTHCNSLFFCQTLPVHFRRNFFIKKISSIFMSNLTISSKSAISPPFVNTSPKNEADNPVSDFRIAFQQLQEKSSVYNPKNIQPTTNLRTDSIDVKEKFVLEVAGLNPIVSEGTTITRTGGTKIPEPIAGAAKLPPVLSDEEEQKIMESSPAYIAAKERSDSAQVEMAARDDNGQIIAVLWKDGSAFAEHGGVIGNTPAETRANLLKMPNVTLERYNANEKAPTRLDIQAEQVAFTKKHPVLFQPIPAALLS